MATGKTFFSYSRADSAFVLKLAKDLQHAGFVIWLDQLDIKGGSHWDATIEEALNAAPNVIVVLSTASVKSNNVMDEVSFALESGKIIIPVLLQECTVPFRLRRLQRIDFTGDYQTGLHQLLEVLNQKVVSENSDSVNFNQDKINKENANEVNKQSDTSSDEESSTTDQIINEKAQQPGESEEIRAHKPSENYLLGKAKLDKKPTNLKATKAAYRKYLYLGTAVIIAGIVIWAIIEFDSVEQNYITDENVSTADTSQQVASPQSPLTIPVPEDLKIGDMFMGGYVFAFYDIFDSQHGLIVVPEDYDVQSTSMDSIKFCNDLQTEIANFKSDGFNGWRLPTLEELRILFEDREHIPGFNLKAIPDENNRTGLYASSPDSNCQAVSKDFKTGREIYGVLNRNNNFRLVREF